MLKALLIGLILGITLTSCTTVNQQVSSTPSPNPTAEPPSIEGNSTYQPLAIMSEPLAQIFTENDQQYKDGYAKFYSFSATKGQKLTLLAQEDIKVKYSFIKTELYDDQGRQLYDRDTRIEFEAPYTGNYYYVVRTFEKRTGATVIKIFDPKRSRDTISVQLENGEVKQLPEGGGTQSFADVQGIIVQFVAPIELKDGSTVVYYDPGEEFRPSFGVQTLPIRVYAAPNINQEQSVGSIRTSSEKEKYRKEIIVTKTGVDSILIEQKDKGLFEPNNVVTIEWSYDDKSSYANGFYTIYP